MKTSVSDRGLFRPKYWESLDWIDDRKVERIAGETARAGIYTCPTLTVFKTAFATGESRGDPRPSGLGHDARGAARSVPRGAREKYWSAMAASEERRMRYVEVRNRLVKAIADSGGKIMTGSDTPEWFFGYGWTFHREMEASSRPG